MTYSYSCNLKIDDMNIKRNKCLITGNENVEHLFTFQKFPVYISCTDARLEDDVFMDMKWSYSRTGTVQLDELIPLDFLYKTHHNSGMVGNIWKNHHEIFFQFIKKYNANNILEIGGASGNLSSKFLNSDTKYTWTNIEPGNHTSNNDKIIIINDYFENYEFEKSYDAVVHSHVLEHIYDPLSFLKKINSVLDNGGYHFISLPNMRYWLSNGYVNTLMFEHTYYIDEDVLESLLSIAGFSIVDKEINNHSLFVCCKKSEPQNKLTYNSENIKNLFLNYISNLFEDVKKIKEKIDSNQKVYIFGAHIFSQMILNLGVKESQIISVLDNDTQKQGKRLYGTNLFIESPLILSEQDNPIVILRAGVYNEEIKESLIKINSNILFV